MAKYKLTYFDMAARAEPIRLAFDYGGIEFEDERISFPKLAEVKPSLPFGQVPILTLEDGTVIAQSIAILAYVGKLVGLVPEDTLQLVFVLQLNGAFEDLQSRLKPTFMEKDLEKKLAMRKELMESFIPSHFAQIDASLKKTGTPGFAIGNKLTICDLLIYCLVDLMSSGKLDGIPTTVLDGYDRIQAIYRNVKAVPQFQKRIGGAK